MAKYKKTKGGIITKDDGSDSDDSRKYVDCGFCPRRIYKDQLPSHGKVKIKDGKPVCYHCQIKHNNPKAFEAMKKDKERAKKDVGKAQEHKKSKEKERIKEIAKESEV